MDIVREGIHSLTSLLMLLAAYAISTGLSTQFKLPQKILDGVMFGLVGILIVATGYEVAPGVYLDCRVALLGATAFMFGPVCAALATPMVIVYRLLIGGNGILMGTLMMLTASAIGLLWRKFVTGERAYSLPWLALMGFVLQAAARGVWVLFMPVAIGNVWYPLLTFDIMSMISTVLICWLLRQEMGWNRLYTRISEADEKYRLLFTGNNTPMFLTDSGGAVLEANASACAFFGYTPQTIKTLTYSTFLRPYADEVDRAVASLFRGENVTFETCGVKASGEVVEVEIFLGQLHLDQKTVLYSAVHDITERAAAIRALRESEQTLQRIIEGAPDTIYIQTEGKFAYINQAGLQMLGASSPEELLGMSILKRVHPEYRVLIEQRIHNDNVHKKGAPLLEEVYIRMDGSPVYVEVNSVPTVYQGRDGAVVFIRDITQRKEMEQKKLEMDAQMRQQQKLEAIGTLAGGVAHEINNPLNGIMNYAQLILDESAGNTDAAQYSHEIIKETSRISVIVKSLLQFSRQEKQSHSYASVYDIVNQTMSLISTIFRRDQINLLVELDKDLPSVKCRSQQIQQVLMNLMTNARDALNEKYTGFDENKQIAVRCSQFTHEGRRWIDLSVEDRGTGISAAVMEKMFEPFFSTKPKELGTGLGLSISHGIVKEHHGRIDVESKVGEYTRFHVILPVDNGWVL